MSFFHFLEMELFSVVLAISFSYVTLGHPVEKREAWGYVNVRKDAHMFWWLYYTDQTADYTSYPLVVWLQGGPGSASSGYGNFMEIGPLDMHLKPRNTTWLQKANLLFLDNPVGTGFSYVTNKSALATTNKQIAQDLTAALSSILDTVPEFQKSPLYIFGESYGGKMAVDFALALKQALKNKDIACNFKGIALGDPWISSSDFINTWGNYLYTMSLLDKTDLAAVKDVANRVNLTLVKQQYKQAISQMSSLQNLIANLTSNVDWFNVLKNEVMIDSGSLNKFSKDNKLYKLFSRMEESSDNDPLFDLMNGKIRQKLHNIPDNVIWGGNASDVFEAISDDFMKNVIDSVDQILIRETDIDVNIYNGQLDLTVDILGTLNWMDKLKWSGLKDFLATPKKPIQFSPNNNCGFLKRYKQLSFFWILKAGHMVPVDAPETALRMLDLILNKKN